VAEVISAWTGIPISQMMETEAVKLLHMEERLHERIVGQDRAIEVPWPMRFDAAVLG
jgi:ATP-dependent Clp protease ATP-binding subunit ClpA